jgi:aspartyl-tRNA synthetase
MRLSNSADALFAAELPNGLFIDNALYQSVLRDSSKRRMRLLGSCSGDKVREAKLAMVIEESELRTSLEVGEGGLGHNWLIFAGEWRRYPRLSRDIYGALLEREQRPDCDSMAWITSFPLFEEDLDNKGRLTFACHPFLLPEHVDTMQAATRNSELLALRGQAFDLVMNGEELGSGSMLISDREVQQRMFHALGLSRAFVRQRFGDAVDALLDGAPPVGGFGFGFDRLVASLADCEHIRDVMAFPKTKTGGCVVLTDN